MNLKITTALISVYNKTGLEEIVSTLKSQKIQIISTGGTKSFINSLGADCIDVEEITGFPEILGGRVKTLNPLIFGGILAKRTDEKHNTEINEHHIPLIDLVIVDLYPFEETVKSTTDENEIIEKIDIGGPSMLRAAAKNFNDVTVISRIEDYKTFNNLLITQNGEITLEQRRNFAKQAFDVCTSYDNSISSYFNNIELLSPFGKKENILRYGENPHQKGIYFGNPNDCFKQIHGKELSYNNLVDVDAALRLIDEYKNENKCVFLILKHTNVCGMAIRDTVENAWKAALEGDPESAFGGVLCSNKPITKEAAITINELFCEILAAPAFENDALEVLKSKKNRILLEISNLKFPTFQVKNIFNGILVQNSDQISIKSWSEKGGRLSSEQEKEDLHFANIIAKHLKSNAISLVKNLQLIGKGCGQTSRIDSLKQAIDKAKKSGFDTTGSVVGSDAFFPFDDCVKIAHQAGVSAFIQPGGSIRDQDSIDYCKENNLAMVITETRHFLH